MTYKKIILSFLIILIGYNEIFAIEEAISGKDIIGNRSIFWLKNNYIKFSLIVENDMLIQEIIEPLEGWYPEDMQLPEPIITDADFNIEIQWTGWLAPNKISNGDNPVNFTKKDFALQSVDAFDYTNDDEELAFTLKGVNNPFELIITYHLTPSTFFIKRQIAIKDPTESNHFLQWIWVRENKIEGNFSITKEGGFGQPVALENKTTGFFAGLEYPTSINKIEKKENEIKILTGQEFGLKVKKDFIKTEWAVIGITPKMYLKQWFNNYLDIIRIAPPKPYLLYNTWYDLRSAEMVNEEKYIMNEQNLLNAIDKLKEKFIDKYDIDLNAFVLDDGWDKYDGNWLLREREFPNGLQPIRKQLESIGTNLGIWYGLSGGYSYRERRLVWMEEHGYEVVGDQLCVAGTKYKELLKEKIRKMIKEEKIAYFKWDGIQFSCSEEGHSHPVGIYSRRAVMEAIAELCQEARQENPNIFLNITSGTWLSPWWVKYANAIWMQGEDYNWADLPSISKREAAITYRDSVLYQNFIQNQLWFPFANLMTHGLIKGNLEKLGSDNESPLNFANDVMLYFSRGISMWELYISPNLLTDIEWDILANAIKWALQKSPILRNTEMIGGNPLNGKVYGYVHFDRYRGIIAVRNPIIQPQTIEINLAESYGLDKNATSLAIMKIYPIKFIEPALYKTNDTFKITLQGYETAIYELQLVDEFKIPLLTGVPFDIVYASENIYKIKMREPHSELKILNPSIISDVKFDESSIDINQLNNLNLKYKDALLKSEIISDKNNIKINLHISEHPESIELAILLSSNNDKMLNNILTSAQIKLNGKQAIYEIETRNNTKWAWIIIKLPPQINSYKASILFKKSKFKNLNLKASAWLIYSIMQETSEITFVLTNKLKLAVNLPSSPLPVELERKISFIGESELNK